MSRLEAEKWQRRYLEGSYPARNNPSPLLADWIGRLPKGRALDLACGRGRHAIYLAQQGHDVDAVDIAPAGLAQAAEAARLAGVAVNWIEADLDHYELPAERYDLIVLVRYVQRDLIARCIDALRPGGHLLIEQHLRTSLAGVVGPDNPNLRLHPNELLGLCSGLCVLEYREGPVPETDGRQAVLARLAAAKPPLDY